MSGARRTNLAAAAARPAAETNAPAPAARRALGSTERATTTKATVYLQMHTWAKLTGTFAEIKARTGVDVSMTGAGAALYGLFLNDPEVQEKVIKELKR